MKEEKKEEEEVEMEKEKEEYVNGRRGGKEGER